MQKGQFTQCIQQIWVVGTVTLVQKGQPPHTVDAVNVGAKGSIHTVYSANMGGEDRYL